MNAKEILEALLEDLCLTQSVFLGKVGVSTSTIASIKKGETKKLSRGVANKIRSVYPQYSLNWLMTGEGERYVEIPKRDDRAIENELIQLLHKKDEQIDRLITLMEKSNDRD